METPDGTGSSMSRFDLIKRSNSAAKSEEGVCVPGYNPAPRHKTTEASISAGSSVFLRSERRRRRFAAKRPVRRHFELR
jgi:hypothetical protein